MNRETKFNEGDAGIFEVTCETCPLLPHLNALGQKPRPCMAGIVTNVQGPVVLKKCEHLDDKGAETKGGVLLLNCMHGE